MTGVAVDAGNGAVVGKVQCCCTSHLVPSPRDRQATTSTPAPTTDARRVGRGLAFLSGDTMLLLAVRREVGANPTRSRRCNWGQPPPSFHSPRRGRRGRVDDPGARRPLTAA